MAGPILPEAAEGTVVAKDRAVQGQQSQFTMWPKVMMKKTVESGERKHRSHPQKFATSRKSAGIISCGGLPVRRSLPTFASVLRLCAWRLKAARALVTRQVCSDSGFECSPMHCCVTDLRVVHDDGDDEAVTLLCVLITLSPLQPMHLHNVADRSLGRKHKRHRKRHEASLHQQQPTGITRRTIPATSHRHV